MAQGNHSLLAPSSPRAGLAAFLSATAWGDRAPGACTPGPAARSILPILVVAGILPLAHVMGYSVGDQLRVVSLLGGPTAESLIADDRSDVGAAAELIGLPESRAQVRHATLK